MKRKLLIVDDNKIERMIISGLLKAEYDIITAESGNEALILLSSQHKFISTIITDIVMPEMNGFEFIEKVRANFIYRQIPIIITTGLEDNETMEKAIALGANGYVTKPYNKTLLFHSIKNVISLRETAALANSLWKDQLTGLLNRDSFFKETAKILARHNPGYYVLSCFDVDNFKAINDQYGTDKGDDVLKYIASCLNDFVSLINGITCHFNADKFAIIYPVEYMNSQELYENHQLVTSPDCINRKIRIRIGRYIVDDLSISVSAMFDRATMAEESIKGRYDIFIADYTA